MHSAGLSAFRLTGLRWRHDADDQMIVRISRRGTVTFAFKQRSSNPELWRAYHAEKVIEMVIQVWMGEEFTRKGESQRPDFWAGHLAAVNRLQVRLVQQMWRKLEPYIYQGRSWQPRQEEMV